LEPADVFVQLKGNDLSFVIANLHGACDVVILKHPAVGRRKDVQGGIYVFSGYVAGAPGGWPREWFARPEPQGRTKQPTEHRLPPGGAMVLRTNMLSVVQHLEQEARANRWPSLPWGRKVLVKVTHLAGFMAELDGPRAPPLIGPQPRLMSVESPTLIYQLPAGPPK
jgi:hypothetical protein